MEEAFERAWRILGRMERRAIFAAVSSLEDGIVSVRQVGHIEGIQRPQFETALKVFEAAGLIETKQAKRGTRITILWDQLPVALSAKIQQAAA